MTIQPGRPSILRIGITGHRPNKLSTAEIPHVMRQLRQVMSTIDSTVRRPETGKDVQLISGFAEGVDQMAVAAAPPHWTVEAILPFPTHEYLKDFEQSAAGDNRDVRGEFLASLARASTVTELPMPTSDQRAHSYLAAGRAMLDRIDLLLAVWDGAEPKTGGTGEIVKEATERGLPVIWLASKAERDPVVVERFAGDTPVVSAKAWTSAVQPS